MDLFRLFSQYYLKIKKYGNISHFVCDFMEGENGIVYFLQVKSFECEGVIHDWQIPFSPKKTNVNTINSPRSANKNQEGEIDPELCKAQCQAKIICNDNKHLENLEEMFIEACKETD